MKLLELKKITKEFRRSNESIKPVEELDFSLNKGDFSVIMGRSGTGKSTLLNIIALFLSPDHGEIYFKDKKIKDLKDEEASRYRNLNIGYLMQELQSISSLTVLENVLLPNFMHKSDQDAVDRANMLLEKLDILHLKDEWVYKLSGGEKKRVCVARSLINSPDMLFLDEPTSNLDEKTSKDLIDLFVQLNKEGLTILVVTHDHSFLEVGNNNYEIRSGNLYKIIS